MSKCTREDECDACHYGFGLQPHELGIKCWMGPIEQGLRAIEFPLRVLWPFRCPDAILDFATDVAEELGLGDEFSATQNVDADVISYAIEAAEALGL